VRYLGLYGLEEIRDGHVWVDPRLEAARPAVMAAQQDLRDCAAVRDSGAYLEDKQYAVAIHTRRVTDHARWTAPIDQVLLPAFFWLDGTALVAGVVWLPVVLAAALVIGSSPLLRERTSALVLCSGVITTVLVLWIAQAYVVLAEGGGIEGSRTRRFHGCAA